MPRPVRTRAPLVQGDRGLRRLALQNTPDDLLKADAGHPGVDDRDQALAVLELSSPIGLGHGRRDLAIAEELRRQVPGLQVDWLAQPPLTQWLRRRGESVHPASAFLASEAAHIDEFAGEHDLHAFQATRAG